MTSSASLLVTWSLYKMRSGHGVGIGNGEHQEDREELKVEADLVEDSVHFVVQFPRDSRLRSLNCPTSSPGGCSAEMADILTSVNFEFAYPKSVLFVTDDGGFCPFSAAACRCSTTLAAK